MTVPATEAKAGPYTGNDSASTFAFDFPVFADEDIRVVETLISTEAETDLVLNGANGYTVVRNVDQDSNPGGEITYKQASVTTPLPSTKTLTIVPSLDFEQPTDIPNGGSFFANILERALDRVTMLIKQIKVDTDRAVKVPVSSDTDPDDLIADLIAASDAAVEAYDSFDDRYLGSKASDPATDNDGDALIEGALYWNTTTNAMRAYDGSAWREIGGAAYTVVNAVGDGVETDFALPFAPASKNNIDLFFDAAYQQKTGYDVAGTTLSFAVAPPNGVAIEFVIAQVLPVSSADSANVTFTPEGGLQTTVQAKLRQVVNPSDAGAVGDGATDDTGAFTALESDYENVAVDLAGRTYLVTSVPTGNRYVNGYFKVLDADGDADVLYPAQETLRLTRAQLTFDNRYSAWPQDKWHEYNGVVYALWNEGPDHSADAEHSVNIARSLDGGKTWRDFEMIFKPTSSAQMSFSAGVVNGMQLVIVRESTIGTGAVTDEKLYGRRLFEIRELTADFSTTLGSNKITCTIPDHGMRNGDTCAMFFTGLSGLGGVTLDSISIVAVGDCNEDTFTITGTANASSSTSTSIAGAIRCFEGQFDEILFGGVSLGNAIIAASGGAIASIPGEIHGFAEGNGDDCYIGVDSGNFTYIAKLANLQNGGRSVAWVRQVTGTANYAEPTVAFDPDTGNLYGFVRSQDVAADPVVFWWSDDELATSPTVTTGPANFGERSPIPCRVVDGKLHACMSGTRFNGSVEGAVGFYWLSADIADAEASGFAAFNIVKIGDLYYSDSGQTAVGVPSLVTYEGTLVFGYSSEHPNILRDLDGTPNIYAAVLDISGRGDGAGSFLNTAPSSYVAEFKGSYTDKLGASDNLILNGSLRFWQRATSQSTNGVNAADRFTLQLSGATGTLTRAGFTLGQTDVPGNPEYYAVLETTVANDNSAMGWLVDSVTTCAGDYCTFDFWINCDTAEAALSASIFQSFGTGGSPSSGVSTSLSFSVPAGEWVRRTLVFKLPSVSGKTLGSDGNSFLRVSVANPSSETTKFRLAMGGLWRGKQAPYTYPERTEAEELAALYRYYQTKTVRTENGSRHIPLFPMRTFPTVAASVGTVGNSNANGFELSHTSAANSAITANAEYE